MEITIETPLGIRKADLDKPISIGITLKQGPGNPNCYGADDPSFETIISGDFVGDVSKGGAVNYQKITITPHGNGTHTECVGHISQDGETINNAMDTFHFLTELITIRPVKNGDDLVLDYEDFKEAKKYTTDAVIIRTLPNEVSKKIAKYTGSNPPYLDPKISEHLYKTGVNHLVVDLPSVDKEVDGGKLQSHNNFWIIPSNKRIKATITELAFIPNEIKDGLYLLNLQLPLTEIDAIISHPVVYNLY